MALLGMSLSGAERRVALALLCACALALAHAHAHAHEKRAESESGLVSPVPFTFAARYGRSPERLITPRNDRWMMTTRYGKRSELTEEGGSLWPPRDSPREERVGRMLSCEYTGVLSLYRCSRMQTLPRVVRRSNHDPVLSREELTPTELTHHYAIATL